MTSVRRLAGAALAVASLAGLVPAVPAAGSAPAPAGSIGAGPRFQAASAPAGDSVTFTFDVRNFNEQDPLPVTFQLADLDPQGWLAGPQTTPYSLVGLATLPDALTLAPGQMKRVSATVRSDGRTHYGSVVVVAGPATAPFARIVLKVVLTPPGAAVEPDVQVTPAATGTVKLDVRNGGDGFLSARGVLFFVSPDGRFLGRLDIPPLAVLPHGASSMNLQWPERLASGTIARAVLTLPGRDTPFLANAAVP